MSVHKHLFDKVCSPLQLIWLFWWHSACYFCSQVQNRQWVSLVLCTCFFPGINIWSCVNRVSRMIRSTKWFHKQTCPKRPQTGFSSFFCEDVWYPRNRRESLHLIKMESYCTAHFVFVFLPKDKWTLNLTPFKIKQKLIECWNRTLDFLLADQ